MAVPKFKDFFYPFLKKLENGKVTKEEMKQYFIKRFALTAEDVSVRTKGGNDTQLESKINWTIQYFKRALLIDMPKRGTYQITQRGKDYLSNHSNLTTKDLMEFPEFAEYKNSKRNTTRTKNRRTIALGSNELIKRFNKQLKLVKSYRLIGKIKNPCHIMFDDVEYYVYIKNLSSAHFKNPDISRAQLTGIDALKEIKKSNALFLLIGYDAKNDVYATWNPHMAKQRIGTAASPSFYSRVTYQKEAAEKGSFVFKKLKNEGAVLVFPRAKISIFMANIDKYFSDTSDYVAMGSKKRSDANAAYKVLNNTKHLEGEFSDYLSKTSLFADYVQDYVWAIEHLISRSLFSKNRKIFLAYDSIEEYKEAAKKFIALEVIKEMDALKNGIFSQAMSHYIDFLIDRYGKKKPSPISHQEDYETPFIDEQGNLTRIANPKLIDLLRDDLAGEYPRPVAAYATIENFYGNRFPNMEMRQWQVLFNQINWADPYVSLDEL